MPVDAEILQRIRAISGAQSVRSVQLIQSLWSGYGSIVRARIDDRGGVVVKIVDPPTRRNHPRGWQSNLAHDRKLASYRVERTFYEEFSHRLPQNCKVPHLLASGEDEHGWVFLFEDLNECGWSERSLAPSHGQIEACLDWLAHFHATFVGVQPEGLWKVGTYWHLDTRPDELAALTDLRIKNAASPFDARLNGCRHMTLVHGDAKVENFCFPTDPSERRVAAVDFQYVGGGCGIKDVVYLLSSCLDERQSERHAGRFVEFYFEKLRAALEGKRPDIDARELEREWRELYVFAWGDFVRFLLGWASEHYKLHGYSRAMTELALDRLDG